MKLVHTSVTGRSAEAVVRELGAYAVERGFADEGYVEAVLDREADFPTGLRIPDESFGIAIPHADPEHVSHEAVVLGLPPEPVAFRSMDDPERTVDAEAVLLLLVEGSDRYTSFLSNLADLFQDDRFVTTVRAGRADAVLALIEDRCR